MQTKLLSFRFTLSQSHSYHVGKQNSVSKSSRISSFASHALITWNRGLCVTVHSCLTVASKVLSLVYECALKWQLIRINTIKLLLCYRFFYSFLLWNYGNLCQQMYFFLFMTPHRHNMARSPREQYWDSIILCHVDHSRTNPDQYL